MTLLGLDYGEKRIGVAITDEFGRYPTPLNFIPNNSELKPIRGLTLEERKNNKKQAKIELKKVFNKLLHIFNSRYPEKIIIGLPLSYDKNTGEFIEGVQARKVKRFVAKLRSFLKSSKILCEIEFIEESMSSVQARLNLEESNYSAKTIKSNIDSESATILLKEFLVKSLND